MGSTILLLNFSHFCLIHLFLFYVFSLQPLFLRNQDSCVWNLGPFLSRWKILSLASWILNTFPWFSTQRSFSKLAFHFFHGLFFLFFLFSYFAWFILLLYQRLKKNSSLHLFQSNFSSPSVFVILFWPQSSLPTEMQKHTDLKPT